MRASAAAVRYRPPCEQRSPIATAGAPRTVLFDQRFWPGIVDGSIMLAFRRWRKPTVRSGGRLRSPAGELAIESVKVITEAAISDSEAHRAGYESRDALLRELNASRGHTLSHSLLPGGSGQPDRSERTRRALKRRHRRDPQPPRAHGPRQSVDAANAATHRRTARHTSRRPRGDNRKRNASLQSKGSQA
jgi:hypothetical protein